MVHAVDGCVPYMTPFLLEKHFPASDDLLIGIKVSDTCVVPVFDSGNKKVKKNKKRKIDADDPSESQAAPDEKGEESSAKNKEVLKHRGYSFGKIEPDSWLLPYTRVTVPSFNLVRDNLDRKQHADVSSANNHVSVWTPNGKQLLSADDYQKSAIGLHSKFCVSLFDMSGESSKRRQEKALARTTEWLRHFVDNIQGEKDQSEPAGKVWAPVLVPPAGSTHEEIDCLSLSHIETHKDVVEGIALVGTWRSELPEMLKDHTENIQNVAMLSTNSLDEVLQIATSESINVIGTDLPLRWAKAKKAFVVNFGDASTSLPEDDSSTGGLDHDGCIDLSHTKFAQDARPIIEGCSCMACEDSTFGRDYIHHLVQAKEMLAEILLFGHNLHHMLEMIRTFSTTNDTKGLREQITSQLGSR